MTTKRITPIPSAPKGKCRGCLGEVPKRRRTWCSDACVETALIRKGDPVVVRPKVFRRDKGVCALCGLDTEQARRVIPYVLDLLSQERRVWVGNRLVRHLPTDVTKYALWNLQSSDAYKFLMSLWTGRDMENRSYVGRIPHLWEADHIVPVIEGGGNCDLDGYRTLCIRCHHEVTRALRARMSERKRAAKRELV